MEEMEYDNEVLSLVVGIEVVLPCAKYTQK